MTSSFSPSAPFLRGKTFYDGQTIDTSNYGNSVMYEGLVAEFANLTPSTLVPRDASRVTCMLVRNVSGITLLPKTTVVWSIRDRRVDGYATNANAAYPLEVAGVVDEHLPSTGVVNGDLFWLTIEGQTLAVATAVADANLTLAAGDPLVASSAAASTFSTTAGRVCAALSTAGTTLIFSHAVNSFAKAVSSRQSTQTGSSFLIDVLKH